jgi:hypothetical protein
MDVNVDGQIDNIKLVFSEDIRDENINNYASAQDSLVAVPKPMMGGTRWTVDGYVVIGINFTRNAASADLATDLVGNDVFNVNDVHDDDTLYLAIVQSGAPDTMKRPRVSMVGGAGGSGVSDYSPNYVESFDSQRPADGAGIALLSAMMTSTTSMEIELSESISTTSGYKEGLKAGTISTWLVGTQEKNWENNVVNITFPTVFGQTGFSRMVFEIAEGQALLPGWPSTLALNAGTIKDANGVTNAATPEPVDVTPAEDIIDAIEVLPDEFSLGTNYPNPFNPTTTIEYAIPADGAGLVELVIYNMNGQKVRTLVSETQDAGYYNVVWDGRNDVGELVSSGIYVYQIVSGSFTKNHKMTFIK